MRSLSLLFIVLIVLVLGVLFCTVADVDWDATIEPLQAVDVMWKIAIALAVPFWIDRLKDRRVHTRDTLLRRLLAVEIELQAAAGHFRDAYAGGSFAEIGKRSLLPRLREINNSHLLFHRQVEALGLSSVLSESEVLKVQLRVYKDSITGGGFPSGETMPSQEDLAKEGRLRIGVLKKIDDISRLLVASLH